MTANDLSVAVATAAPEWKNEASDRSSGLTQRNDERPSIRPTHNLPAPPTDQERYSTEQRTWPFLFAMGMQLRIAFGYTPTMLDAAPRAPQHLRPQRRKRRTITIPEASATPALPTPPTDGEKYAYLQPQGRHLVGVQTLVSVTISAVLTWFFLQHAVLMPFALVTVLNIAYAAVSAATGMHRRRVDLDSHVLKVSAWRPEHYPSIDVFLPSCGEPLDVVGNTFRHVAALDWPGQVNVLVLDDSARLDVELLAMEYGFDYHTRPDRGRMKKAGNLLYGYEHSSGDLIAVFDADFCPRPDFLHELVPYFDDQAVAIVQSPQYFQTHGTMNWLQSGAGTVQEIFYRWVQPSRDASSGAICVGTCALYRREGLQASGGFAQIGHSEDVHTGVNLMKVGYNVRYVPVNVSAGLCPDNFAGFLSQQYRWCAGSLSLLADASFHSAPLTLRQRACFFTGFLYYLSTAITLFGGPMAAAVLLWALPTQVWPWVYLPLVAASWCLFMAWRCTLITRWNVSVMRVQMLYSAAHMLALLHSLRGHTAAWVSTGSASKGASLSTRITRLLVIWLVTIEVIIIGGVTRGIAQYGWERFWLSAILTALALTIIVPILRPLKVRPGRLPARRIRVASPVMVWGWLLGALGMLAAFAAMMTGAVAA